MKISLIKNQNGFTLVELLISISIMGIILMAFSSLYVMGIKTYQREVRNSNLQTENRIILDRIVKDAKGAIGVETDINPYVSNTSDTLILKVPSIDENKKYIYEANGNFVFDYMVYQKTDNNLIRLIIPDPLSSRVGNNVKTISDKVTAFNITYYPDIPDARDLTINLRMEDYSGKEFLAVDNKTDVKFRNK